MATRYRTAAEMLDVIRARMKAHGGSQAAFAAGVLGISPSHLSDILAGKRSLSDRVCEVLGFTRLTVYTTIDPKEGPRDETGRTHAAAR